MQRENSFRALSFPFSLAKVFNTINSGVLGIFIFYEILLHSHHTVPWLSYPSGCYFGKFFACLLFLLHMEGITKCSLLYLATCVGFSCLMCQCGE